jgi:hypothetical protein
MVEMIVLVVAAGIVAYPTLAFDVRSVGEAVPVLEVAVFRSARSAGEWTGAVHGSGMGSVVRGSAARVASSAVLRGRWNDKDGCDDERSEKGLQENPPENRIADSCIAFTSCAF